MANTNSQSNCIERIRKILKLRSNECMLKDGSIVVEPEKGKEKLVIEVNISRILKMCNSKRFKFRNCIFKEPIILKQITFGEILYFINSTFEGDVDFSRSLFKKRVFFSESTFNNKASFAEVIFEQNAYFDEARFLGEADFGLSEFNKNAHFYGTYFDEFPNFIQAIFNEDVNFTNTELDFGFDEVKNKIEKSYNNRKAKYNMEQNENKEKPKKYKIANEFRDSFRNIKSLLIEHHNMLDASNYHRVELYCKELELGYRREEKAKNSGIRDVVDRIQLMLYRITSDHHTDLMLILNNVIFLIALFGIMNLGLCFYAKNITVDCVVSKIYSVEILEACITALLFVAISLCFMLDCYKSFIKNILYIKNSIFSNKFYIQTFIALLLFAIIVYAAFLAYPNSLWIFISFIFLNSVIIISFVLFVYFNFLESLFNKKAIFILSYFIVALMLILKPSSILPVLGKLIDNKNGACLFTCENFRLIYNSAPALETLNLLYMLLLFLLLFSLQKTARKNTIIPN
ncbi:MAG: pentapeptide repeat-containing protein [Helicobacter sp.]|nr:pentapeptide repeat-containing protein [Helicobacter sp.]